MFEDKLFGHSSKTNIIVVSLGWIHRFRLESVTDCVSEKGMQGISVGFRILFLQNFSVVVMLLQEVGKG